MSTALDAYLKARKVSDADFATLIGRDRSMVSKLRRGVIRPTLDIAAVIEGATKGKVPMKVWIAPDAPAPLDRVA